MSFCIGLALTLVASGTLPGWSLQYVAKRRDAFSNLPAKVPYFSATVMALIGVFLGYQGLHTLLS